MLADTELVHPLVSTNGASLELVMIYYNNTKCRSLYFMKCSVVTVLCNGHFETF